MRGQGRQVKVRNDRNTAWKMKNKTVSTEEAVEFASEQECVLAALSERTNESKMHKRTQTCTYTNTVPSSWGLIEIWASLAKWAPCPQATFCPTSLINAKNPLGVADVSVWFLWKQNCTEAQKKQKEGLFCHSDANAGRFMYWSERGIWNGIRSLETRGPNEAAAPGYPHSWLGRSLTGRGSCLRTSCHRSDWSGWWCRLP